MIVKNFPSSVYKTCGPADLEMWTLLGWNIVALVQEDDIEFHEEMKNVEISVTADSNGYANVTGLPTTHMVSQPFATRKVLFLLALDLESAIKRATEKKEEALAERELAKEWATAADKARENAEKQRRHAESKEQWEKEQSAKRDKEVISANERVRAMEGDIAKVREAVGGDRMKEIIGRDVPKKE